MSHNTLLNFENVKQFRRDLWGDEFAHCVARITIGWGNIEHALFLLLQAIDTTRVVNWVDLLFRPLALEQRKGVIRDQIKAAVQVSYPTFIDHLERQLTLLSSIQTRRNVIAHGLWRVGGSDHRFLVQPLKLAKGTVKLEIAVEVDNVYLSDLIQDMDFLEQGLYSLGSEMLAHQQLKKWGLR